MSKEKKLIIYRDWQDHAAEDRGIMFSTEPFLVGVGCGGGALSDDFRDTLRDAVAEGYRVVLVKYRAPGQDDPLSGKYPLHPNDLSELEDMLAEISG
jgi:hypothetical protein